MKKTILLCVASFFVLAFAIAVAQEDSSSSAISAAERLVIETKAKDTPAVKGLKLEKEFKPRVPNGFVSQAKIDAKQREEIYKILTEYHELIDLLELRVQLLKEERDAKVDAVLTPAQQQRLNRPVRNIIAR